MKLVIPEDATWVEIGFGEWDKPYVLISSARPFSDELCWDVEHDHKLIADDVRFDQAIKYARERVESDK